MTHDISTPRSLRRASKNLAAAPLVQELGPRVARFDIIPLVGMEADGAGPAAGNAQRRYCPVIVAPAPRPTQGGWLVQLAQLAQEMVEHSAGRLGG